MSQKTFISLHQPEDISLEHHGVIEASAGTGKTYTLIELVMRLLMEKRMPLEKILLVTFTEQATGELKNRIRKRIGQEIDKVSQDIELKKHLERSLGQVNQASIYTIHGFCHGALREFAFEQGMVFETQVANDKDLRQKLLQKMKRDWPSDKQLAGQLKNWAGDKSIHSLDETLLDLANQFKSGVDGFYPSIDELKTELLLEDLQAIDFALLAEWEAEYKSLKGLQSTSFKNNWLNKVKPWLVELQQSVVACDLAASVELIENHFKGDSQQLKKVFFFRVPKVFDSKAHLQENLQLAPKLFALIELLANISAAHVARIAGRKVQFIPQLIDTLNDAVQRHKTEHGLISYDDMITHLWAQLQAEQSLAPNQQALTQALQKKYQVALIDEFQDTDSRQWEIFKQLFLQNQKQKLWVIGDPKQAIYSFRGADVNTYFQATTDMLHSHQGRAYRLNTNYRTEQPLISVFNDFFSKDEQGGWFETEEVWVKVPDGDSFDEEQRPHLIENPADIAPLSQLQVSFENADQLKTDLATAIANTIKHQLLNQITFKLKGKNKTLQAEDICILVRGKKDAEYLEQALQAVKVPYTYHKKQDLYQSTEAIHFEVLLTALANPDDAKRVNNALVSLFFDLKPRQLSDFSDEKIPYINDLWLKIKEAVTLKNWIKVFDLLLNESGAMFRHRHNSRRMANIKQLKQQLLEEALQNNLEARGLLKSYQYWRQNRKSDEALHHKDTEQSAVKIMTMHISKGLEFPVVFIFGGFTTKKTPPKFLKFYDSKTQATVFDLVNQHQQVYQHQQIKEAQQLYYVAMTRAIFMLFVPNVINIEHIKHPGFYTDIMVPRINQMALPIHEPIAVENSTKRPQKSRERRNLILPELPTQLHLRRQNLHSFSSLSRLKSHVYDAVVEENFTSGLASELLLNNDLTGQGLPSNQAAQIPGGVKTGLVLHGIFEHVSFAVVAGHESLQSLYQDESVMTVVDEQMTLFRLENKPLPDETGQVYTDYRKQLADWVWHTLRKPLDALDGLMLGQVTKSQRIHELSFFWSQQNTNLTGFIDLFFAVPAGQFTDYYILDWKSNLSPNGYSPEVLAEEVMSKHQYNWQYQLYTLAMQRWFDTLKLDQARLKGAIYVFSRGMNCQETVQNGVFFDDFEQSKWRLNDIENELLYIDQREVL